MKKKLGVFAIPLCLVALGLIFSFAACNSSGGGGSGAPVYSGKFNITAASTIGVEDEVLFELNSGAGRAGVTSSSFALTGKLKDSSGVHELRGSYDPDSGWFSLSAEGNNLLHCISGAFGSSSGWTIPIVNAAVYNKSKTDNSAADTFETFDNEGAIDGNAGDPAGGMPSQFWGRWQLNSENTEGNMTEAARGVLLISRFTIANSFTKTTSYSDSNEIKIGSDANKLLVAEVEQQTDGSYDVIIVYPNYPKDNDSKKAAFGAYCEFKGVEAEAVTDEADPKWVANDKLVYFAFDDGKIITHNGYNGFSVGGDWEEFLLGYLRDELKLPPVTAYGKWNLKILGDGAFHYEMCHAVAGDDGDFPTLAEAKTAVTGLSEDTEDFYRE